MMMVLDNENLVARVMGNSPKIIHTHYRGGVRREEVEQFIELSPDNVPNTPIELPKGGTGRRKPGKLI
jgi:hypothetical protein